MWTRVRSLVATAGFGKVPTPALAVACVLCLCVAVSGFVRWSAGSRVVIADSGSVTGLAGLEASAMPNAKVDSGAEQKEPEATLFVAHVVGAVVAPGVYEVPEGARVGDAVALAGGLTGNAAEAAVNLARVLCDGEQVYVPTAHELAESGPALVPPSAGGGVGQSASASGQDSSPGLVDVNRADAGLLETLPGIGPVTAQRIVDDRTANGPFGSVDDLLRVSGIGEKKLESIRDLVTVG